MAITWQLESEHLGIMRVSAKLGIKELNAVQSEAVPAIQASGAFKLLIFLDGFDGWTAEKGWEDTSFADDNDEQLKKMAFVGEERWCDLIYAFTLKGMRPTEIEYFGPDGEAQARQWLDED
jgi:hypothetical protein